ncbi:interferon regulatory factor 10 [Erpetoichthys calabaricus]|uniref:Interferon regulatory factor 10 n=1 Tax=Erpetoichthys calabaricus TaxID=27687 RepID=A0A8C4S4Q7_ERPCA|nr:interferon regulatory factor 10 [Erpetoichthys calabaricus]XP_028667644.1 interferon regulatory factor 10 [Erpetoichthys calabaricus]
MEDNSKNMRLREWLIAQIESGKYAGLSWENHEKTMFRIPWKHAAKQDYNQNEDAALFKAWAVYKGKFREGKDKADPSAWKTRLRCALNKSTDFQEVPDRSQLDISEPYKVYEILQEGGKKTDKPCTPDTATPTVFPTSLQKNSQGTSPVLSPQFMQVDSEWKDSQVQCRPVASVKAHVQDSSHSMECDGHVKGSFYTWTLPGAQITQTQTLQSLTLPTQIPISDFRLNVRLFYQGILVRDFTTSTADGCRILHGTVPIENEQIYGPSAMEHVQFPPPEQSRAGQRVVDAMNRLLPHLERGVLLWVAPDGVFVKRLCQGRVYWNGPLAQHSDRPNKLERERTCKLLDVQLFLQELQEYFRNGRQSPRFEIILCFGEEFPDPAQDKSKKLITAYIEPVFARELYLNRKSINAGRSQFLTKSNGESGPHGNLKCVIQQ